MRNDRLKKLRINWLLIDTHKNVALIMVKFLHLLQGMTPFGWWFHQQHKILGLFINLVSNFLFLIMSSMSKSSLINHQLICIKEKQQKVYKLKNAIYGQKQALQAWYSGIDSFFSKIGFQKCSYEHMLYVKSRKGRKFLIVYIYVDA